MVGGHVGVGAIERGGANGYWRREGVHGKQQGRHSAGGAELKAIEGTVQMAVGGDKVCIVNGEALPWR